MSARWWRWAGGPVAPVVLGLVLLLLVSPAFQVGSMFEDWAQRDVLRAETWDPLAMFRLVSRPGDLAVAQQLGIAPWWSDPELRLAFFRPLSAATHRLDWRYLPDLAWLRVAHTLLWWVAAGAGAFRVYRQLLASRAAAVVATFVWMADDARAMPIGWLANRNALVAAAFGFWALALHLQWRSSRRLGELAGAVVLTGLSLLAAEAGVGTLSWLVAAAIAFESRWLDRLRALAPYGLVVIPWVVAWKGLGFGTSGSGSYFDPLQEPLAYAGNVLQNAPLLWASQWLGPVATAASVTAPAWRWLWVVPSMLFAAVLATWTAPLARDDRMRFALLGSGLSLLPVCAVFPGERLLGFVALGAAALLGGALHELHEAPWTHRRPWRVVTRLLAVPALVVGPLCLPVQLWSLQSIARQSTDSWSGWAPGDESVSGVSVVALTAPCSMCSGYLAWIRADQHQPVPGAFRIVAPSWDEVEVVRTGPDTLTARAAHGFGAPIGDGNQWHGPVGTHVLAQTLDQTFGVARGDAPIDVSVFVVRVLDRTSDGRPQRVELTFPVALEDPSLRFVRFSNGRMVDAPLPGVGASVRFAPERLGVPGL